ncbi:hypothetical protein [Nostocoides sp. HKS02]|uniref:hypothetical protein n=1 Tax=Nostocoides sp. HKS02 TaxID=1813880 RepID=UPI0012B4D1D4|nr:hypothetical protein [Tetrasphaera sp. HKS02]QGN57770.1 hypothetical protein GKE56_07655 [Tetrasphaera sp. HKS02]
MFISRTRLRASLAAAALAGGVIVAGATAASAAPGTTITLDPSDAVITSEPLVASGSCASGSRTAVVTVSQNGSVLTQGSANLSGSLTYRVTLDVSQGTTGLASVAVDCFKYPTAAPVGSASTAIGILEDSLVRPIAVTVSPSKVHLGGQLTVTGACPAGTPSAEVLIGSGNNDQPFYDQIVTPAADGTVTVTTTVKPGRYVTVGDAGAVVACGTPDNPAGFGFADFTLLAALPTPARPAAPAAADPASAVPTLARTGTNGLPMTGAALGLLAVGGLLQVARRRLRA